VKSGAIKYPLTSTGDGQVDMPGEFTLHGLNEKIKETAVSNVEKTMSPKEREQLATDSAQYAEAMKRYDRQTKYFIGMHPPSPPAQPDSLRRYEQAIDHEIANLSKKMEGNV
jgi:hypothetical protein